MAALGMIILLSNCMQPQISKNTASSEDSCIAERARLDSNKALVMEFYQRLFGDKDISAIDQYIAEDYIQHNPIAADGRQALKNVLEVWFRNAPKDTVDFQRVAADGDLVFLHIKSEMGGKTVAIVDIFRIEDGMIAEHWDVIQEVPEKSANEHPMF